MAIVGSDGVTNFVSDTYTEIVGVRFSNGTTILSKDRDAIYVYNNGVLSIYESVPEKQKFVNEIKVKLSDSTSIKERNIIGLINGSNATFTTGINYDAIKVLIFLNGLRQKIIDDYQLINNYTIQFVNSPTIGDKIIVIF